MCLVQLVFFINVDYWYLSWLWWKSKSSIPPIVLEIGKILPLKSLETIIWDFYPEFSCEMSKVPMVYSYVLSSEFWIKFNFYSRSSISGIFILNWFSSIDSFDYRGLNFDDILGSGFLLDINELLFSMLFFIVADEFLRSAALLILGEKSPSYIKLSFWDSFTKVIF